ncbi:30S ribosomal protein S6e [Candidatus Woesearchaeota archaeon]|nr:30S ribosomal protein S6e [Candidatus Woesearchaeota archaeon]
MVSFKLCIGDAKTGKCYQKEAKDQEAQVFLNLNIGENVSGDSFGMPGYEFLITGGSDYCGFPMRHGIQGIRKKIYSTGGVGFPKLKKGEKTRKTVCGHKINEKITQINLKIVKEGTKKIEDVLPSAKKEGEEPAKEKPKKEEKKEAAKEAPKEEPKKEEKKEAAKEAPKEEEKK